VFIYAPDASIVAIVSNDEARDGMVGIAKNYDTILSETDDIGGSDTLDWNWKNSQIG
jgi:hypothetical protein